MDNTDTDDTELSKDAIPWAHRHDASNVRFWYKSRGLSAEGHPASWEGGFTATSIKTAMSVVKIRSLHWRAREVYFIAIFEVDDVTGIIELDPSLWQNFSKKVWQKKEMRLELTGPNNPVKDQVPMPKVPHGQIHNQYETDKYCQAIRESAQASKTIREAEAELAEAVHKTYEEADWTQEPTIDLPQNFSTLTPKETRP